jgi:hypothetical protein
MRADGENMLAQSPYWTPMAAHFSTMNGAIPNEPDSVIVHFMRSNYPSLDKDISRKTLDDFATRNCLRFRKPGAAGRPEFDDVECASFVTNWRL